MGGRRSWAPKGAARFREMMDSGFKGIRFFRVISGFMAQFGISGDPKRRPVAPEAHHGRPRDSIQHAWHGVLRTSGPNSRTTQMFINFGNNANLDGMGFAVCQGH